MGYFRFLNRHTVALSISLLVLIFFFFIYLHLILFYCCTVYVNVFVSTYFFTLIFFWPLLPFQLLVCCWCLGLIIGELNGSLLLQLLLLLLLMQTTYFNFIFYYSLLFEMCGVVVLAWLLSLAVIAMALCCCYYYYCFLLLECISRIVNVALAASLAAIFAVK